MTNLVPCPGCRAHFPDTKGATHRYIESSPGCWAAYGEVLAREYADSALFSRVHRLTVDTYAVQHPGKPSPRSIRSVALHLVSLCLVLEHGAAPQEATAALQEAAHAGARYIWLSPSPSLGLLTVADVYPAAAPAAHEEAVRRWAGAVWLAWSPHHTSVRAWLPKVRAA